MYARQIILRHETERRALAEPHEETRMSNDLEKRTSESHRALQEKLKKVPSIPIGKYELRFELDDSEDFFVEKARRELRESPEVIAQALKEIRELVRGEPDLLVPDEDDFYQKFLRPCKWYAKSAFELMQRFYRFRLNYPHVCIDLRPSNERAVFTSGVLLPLPIRSVDGCRILLVESGRKWKPKEVSLEQMFKAVMLSLDAAMSEPKTQIAGVRVILNMDGLSLSQVTYFTPSFAAMVVEWVQKCLPSRLKGIHIVNQPFIFNMVFALFKPFLQEKLRKRIHFHGTDRETLVNLVGVDAVPTIFGGNLEIPEEPVGEVLWKYFCEFEEDFEASNTYGYTGPRKK